MRPTLAWLATLTSGFAALMLLFSIAFLPVQASKNRAVYRVVDQYATRLAESQMLPRNAKVDDAFTATTQGVRVWRALPGGCQTAVFEAPTDRFVLGFWENGSADRFGSSWWRCYAYPSRNTTLQLSVTEYISSEIGLQLLVYALLAITAGYVAFRLRPGSASQHLTPLTKVIWFGVFLTSIHLFYALQDSGDDEFFKDPTSTKWFVFIYDTLFALR